MNAFILLVEKFFEILFGIGMFCLLPFWFIGGYILKSWKKYVSILREKYFPDNYSEDFQVRFIDFIVYIGSLKWMNTTMWVALFWNLLALLYHFFLFNDVASSLIFQATALLMEWAIAPSFEETLKVLDGFIKRDGLKKIVVLVNIYKQYTFVFILYFVTTYYARILILFSLSDQWGLGLTTERIELGMANTAYFALLFGWLVSKIAISGKEKRFTRENMRKILRYLKKLFKRSSWCHHLYILYKQRQVFFISKYLSQQ